MSSSIAVFAFHRAIRPMIKLRYFSFRAFCLGPPRVLAPETLTPSRIFSSISVPFAFTKDVKAEGKIRRTDGDENLLHVIKDKINERAPLEAELEIDSPFEIIDQPGMSAITLKREFQGEKIKVLAYYFGGDADEEESEQDAAEGPNTDDGCQPYFSLLVTIDKAGTALQVSCHLYAEDLDIVSVTMGRPKDSDEGFDYSGRIDMDEDWRKVLNGYLGARGIKVSLFKSLRECLVTMDDRRCILRLKKLKEFVEN